MMINTYWNESKLILIKSEEARERKIRMYEVDTWKSKKYDLHHDCAQAGVCVTVLQQSVDIESS